MYNKECAQHSIADCDSVGSSILIAIPLSAFECSDNDQPKPSEDDGTAPAPFYTMNSLCARLNVCVCARVFVFAT